MTIKNFTRLPLAGSLLLLFCITGCGTVNNSADLRLACVESDAAFSQKFRNAYISKGADGNTEVVLANDADAALRHVMHVKVLWRPQRGTKQAHPSYTNAALHWYVIDGAAVLEYTGAGFVALGDTMGGTKVTIRNATIKPVAASNGSLSDPVGPASVKGSFVAKKSSQRVNELLAEVKSAVNSGNAQQAAAR